MNLKKLWAEEPVIVSGVLSLATSIGVLTATEASAVGAAIAGIVNVIGLFVARRKVAPTRG